MTKKYTFTTFTAANSVTIETGISDIKVTLKKNNGSTKPAFYSPQARLYAKGSITISSESHNITSIKFYYTINKNNSGKVPSIDKVNGSTNAGTWDSANKTWTGQDKSITMTTSGDAGNIGFTSIDITYTTTPDAPTPELESIDFEAANDIVYYVGETVTEKGLTVTANYTNGTNADVTKDVENWTFTPRTINSINDNSISVEFDYAGKTYNTYSFNITVKSIANTAESAYTVAQACAIIDADKGLSEEVYVKGIVSQVDSDNTTYGSITYCISDDVTTAGQQFLCYGGLNIGGE